MMSILTHSLLFLLFLYIHSSPSISFSFLHYTLIHLHQGLNALLTYCPTIPATNLTRTRVDKVFRPGETVSSLPDDIRWEGNAGRGDRSRAYDSPMEEQLVGHVRKAIPYESLRELSEEIGTCHSHSLLNSIVVMM
jgi:hypothetical protein